MSVAVTMEAATGVAGTAVTQRPPPTAMVAVATAATSVGAMRRGGTTAKHMSDTGLVVVGLTVGMIGVGTRRAQGRTTGASSVAACAVCSVWLPAWVVSRAAVVTATVAASIAA